MSDFQIIAKPSGSLCNLNCTYCYYLEKHNLYPQQNSEWHMSDDVLENFIRQYIQAQSRQVVSFIWQGGEPTLLGIDFFRRVLQLQERYRRDKHIENAFQTNGILLDDEWAEFLASNKFLVGISIDGPEEFHDAYRVDKAGQSTFARVLRGLDLLKRHGVDFNTLTVVNRHNSYAPTTVYNFLKDIGSKYIQFLPVAEMQAHEPTSDGLRLLKPYARETGSISEWSVEPEQYGHFLTTIFDEWVRKDVGKTFVQLFDVALESWVGVPQSLCVFGKECGTELVTERNGDVYSCDHFVFPDNRLGNLLDTPLVILANSSEQKRFGARKSNRLPEFCERCDVRFACNGECPKHRFVRTPSGEGGLNYLCPSYKIFFHHVAPYMQYMASQLMAQKAPANVMEWVKSTAEPAHSNSRNTTSSGNRA